MKPASVVSTEAANAIASEDRPYQVFRPSLEKLRRFRREQQSAERSGLNATVTLSVVFTVGAILIGSLVGWLSPWNGGCAFVGSLVFLALSGILACHLSRWGFAALRMTVRIPVVLFFQARMHLIELLLIVAFLGNGMGLIVGCAPEGAVGSLLLLSALWIITVMGGAAWGLWAATILDEERTSTRCTMVLAGILTPGAIIGLVVGPVFLVNGLASLPSLSVDAIWDTSFGLITVVASLWLLRLTLGFHSEAWNALQFKRLQQRRRNAQERTLGPEEDASALAESIHA